MMINERVYEGFCNLSKQLEKMSGFKLILPSWNDVNQLGEEALASLCLPGEEVQEFKMDKSRLDQCRRAVSLAKLDRPLDAEYDSRQSVKVPHVTETVRVRLEPVKRCEARQFSEVSLDVRGPEKVQESMPKVEPGWTQKGSETLVDNGQQEKAQESTPNAEVEQTQEALPDVKQEDGNQELNALDASVMGARMPEEEVQPAGRKNPRYRVRGVDWGRSEALRRGPCFDSNNKGKDIQELYTQAIAAYSL